MVNGIIANSSSHYASLRSNVPKSYVDHRELLDDPSIDAVVIGTPDHWHCKIMVDAVRADVSWTGGVTGVLKTAHLAESFHGYR